MSSRPEGDAIWSLARQAEVRPRCDATSPRFDATSPDCLLYRRVATLPRQARRLCRKNLVDGGRTGLDKVIRNMTTWTHPTLGGFCFDYIGWHTQLELPAFTRFDATSRWLELDVRDPTTLDLIFEADDDGDFPDEDMVRVALDLIGNHVRLISEGVGAFYGDIVGDGPDSGMCLHGSV